MQQLLSAKHAPPHSAQERCRKKYQTNRTIDPLLKNKQDVATEGSVGGGMELWEEEEGCLLDGAEIREEETFSNANTRRWFGILGLFRWDRKFPMKTAATFLNAVTDESLR